MAKVKGHNPPETEFAYDDATGDRHYLGEFIRFLFGGASLSPRDIYTDIIGRSRRGDRPTEKGDLTARRKFVRKAFKSCINLWTVMPVQCPFFEEDPPLPSKTTVWEAKIAQGVVCSYFDVWMRCCMRYAMDNDGAMPVSECFPCVAECKQDPAMAWDYEASEEEVDRGNSVTIAITGLNGPFTWEVSGTGFSLEYSTTGGLTNTLHADETASGVARIFVVGCDEQSASGWVKCTTGQWVEDLPFDESPGGIAACSVCWCSTGSGWVDFDAIHRALFGGAKGDTEDPETYDPCYGGHITSEYTVEWSDGFSVTQTQMFDIKFYGAAHCIQFGCWKPGASYKWAC